MKLAGKFILVLLLGVLLMLAVNAYVRARFEIRIIEDATKGELPALGNALAIAVENIWRVAGQDEAMRFAHSINDAWRGIDVRWVNLPHKSPGPDSGKDASDEAVRRELRGVGKPAEGVREEVNAKGLRSFHVRVPVSVGSPPVAAIELSQSMENMDESIEDALTIISVTAVAFFLVFGALVVALGVQLVGRPVRKLIEGARRVGAGDLQTQIQIRQRDELSELAEEFNAMCRKLSQARDKLEAETAERMATIEQLRHADRLTTVGKLSAGIAHELGTPLNVILARAKRISSRVASGDAIGENARIIAEQTERITRTIRQLLDFARPHNPRKTKIDLFSIALQSVELLEPAARKAGVSIKVVGAERPLMAEVDSELIQQVLSNLILNAVQATPQSRGVDLELRSTRTRQPEHGGPERDYVRMDVRDEGSGIRPEHLSRLFEPFFTTKKAGEGTGLGLSVSEGIIREHGGWIEVYTQEGKGSCFSVFIPVGKLK